MSVTSKMKECTLDLRGSELITAPVHVITEMNFRVP